MFRTTKSAESVALVEVSADSIAGGFVYLKQGTAPFIVYAARIPIDKAGHESHVKAVSRTLEVLGQSMLREGAPLLHRVAGSGRLDSVLVSVKAPWQETNIRSEKIERTSPFTFTTALLTTALEKSVEPPQAYRLVDTCVVGTVLDGYEIKKPIGRRASRVNITILSSFIEESLYLALTQSFRELFHLTSVRFVSASAVRYGALRTIFPHEEEYLTIDVSNTAISTTLVRHRLLSAIENATITDKKDAWSHALTQTLETVTKRYPLPRKILFFAPESERANFKQKIETAPLSSLRLSVEPLLVVPIVPSQVTDFIRLAENVNPDLSIELMAVFLRSMAK